MFYPYNDPLSIHLPCLLPAPLCLSAREGVVASLAPIPVPISWGLELSEAFWTCGLWPYTITVRLQIGLQNAMVLFYETATPEGKPVVIYAGKDKVLPI